MRKFKTIGGELVVDQPTKVPNRKVTHGSVIGGGAGAAATVLVVAWNSSGIGEPLTIETAGAIVTVVASVAQFIGGYFTLERA